MHCSTYVSNYDVANKLMQIDTKDFGSIGYWDQTYEKDSVLEWYAGYDVLRQYIPNSLGKSGRILMSGCGNSTLSNDMAKDGFCDIVNVDASKVVISKMKKKYPELNWQCHDMQKLPFESASFDCIIDKGTIDAIMCGVGGIEFIASNVISEIYRLLKDGGTFLLISNGTPDFRMDLLNLPKYQWNISHETFVRKDCTNGKKAFVYTVIKQDSK